MADDRPRAQWTPPTYPVGKVFSMQEEHESMLRATQMVITTNPSPTLSTAQGDVYDCGEWFAIRGSDRSDWHALMLCPNVCTVPAIVGNNRRCQFRRAGPDEKVPFEDKDLSRTMFGQLVMQAVGINDIPLAFSALFGFEASTLLRITEDRDLYALCRMVMEWWTGIDESTIAQRREAMPTAWREIDRWISFCFDLGAFFGDYDIAHKYGRLSIKLRINGATAMHQMNIGVNYLKQGKIASSSKWLAKAVAQPHFFLLPQSARRQIMGSFFTQMQKAGLSLSSPGLEKLRHVLITSPHGDEFVDKREVSKGVFEVKPKRLKKMTEAEAKRMMQSSIDNQGWGTAPADQECHFCRKTFPRLYQCSRCKSARYCSIDHQRAAWKTHKKVCKQMAARHQANENKDSNTDKDSGNKDAGNNNNKAAGDPNTNGNSKTNSAGNKKRNRRKKK